MEITLNRQQEVRLIEIGLGTLLGNLTPTEKPRKKKVSKKVDKKKSRRKMSVAERKAIGKRMRQYWAERRKSNK